MRCHRLLFAAGLLLLASGCRKDAEKVEPPSLGAAFPSVLIPPQGSLISQSGSQDALQLTFRSPEPLAEVAAYYRGEFQQSGWNIVSDLADSTGTISMHVDWAKTDQPMWLQLSSVAGGTQVEMVGAVPSRDSSYVRRSQAAEDTSNTFRPR